MGTTEASTAAASGRPTNQVAHTLGGGHTTGERSLCRCGTAPVRRRARVRERHRMVVAASGPTRLGGQHDHLGRDVHQIGDQPRSQRLGSATPTGPDHAPERVVGRSRRGSRDGRRRRHPAHLLRVGVGVADSHRDPRPDQLADRPVGPVELRARSPFRPVPRRADAGAPRGPVRGGAAAHVRPAGAATGRDPRGVPAGCGIGGGRSRTAEHAVGEARCAARDWEWNVGWTAVTPRAASAAATTR